MAGLWTKEDEKTLIALMEEGVSAHRIAVRMKRPLQTIKKRARDIGKPFPAERDLKRARMKILNPPK